MTEHSGEFGHPEDEEVCGFSFDHDTITTYEDEDGYQWECRRCCAEGWEEPADSGSSEQVQS